MKKILSFYVLFLLLLHAHSSSYGGVWKSYINNNDIRSIAVGSDFVWCATSGGLTRWDRHDGSYIRFTKEDGLLSNDLGDIAIDGSGFAWMSYNDVKMSVSHFDGSSWTVYDSRDIGLPNRTIECIFADSNNRIWLGTAEGGVARYDGISWKRFDPIQGLDQERTMAVDRDGVVWFGTRFGVLRWDGKSWIKYTIEDGLPDNTVRSVAVDTGGGKWFATVLGLVRFDGSAWTTFTRDDGLVDTRINALAFDHKGVLWIGTSSGVSRFDGSIWTSYTIEDGLLDNAVSSVAIDSDDHVWFSHGAENKGVSFFDGEDWRRYTRWNSGLPSNTVHSIVCGGDGVVWFGTDKGLSRFDGVSWVTYTSVNGLANNTVVSVFIDSSETVWVSYGKDGDAGVSRFNGSTWTTLAKKNGLIDNAVIHIAEIGKGTMLFVTPNGVSRFDGSLWRNFSLTEWLLSPTVSSITEDKDGNLWFATRKGLTRYNGSMWKTYTSADSTVSDNFIDVKVSQDGLLWCVSAEGILTSFDSEEFTVHPLYGEGIPSEVKIGAISIGSDGTVRTDAVEVKAGDGIYTREMLLYDGSSWKNHAIEVSPDVLQPEMVTDIISDNVGVFWLATRNGLKRYDGSSSIVYTIDSPFENSIQSIAVDRLNVKIFGTRRGVYTFDENTWESISPYPVTSVAIDRNNDHWYGTPDGVLTYDHTGWKRYTKEDGLSNNDVRMVTVDTNNVKWFATAYGVSKFSGGNWSTHFIKRGLNDDIFRVLTTDRNDTIWVGSGLWPELWSFDGSMWKHYRHDDGSTLNRIQAITTDRNNILWIGTYYGMKRYDGVSLAEITGNSDLPSRNVTAVAVDLDNVLWVGTDRGMARYDGSSWETFTEADGLINNTVTSIAVDMNNTKWVGTTGGISSFSDYTRNESESVPARIVLHGSYPNPFNTSTMIGFELASWGSVTITVYNSAGQKVREIKRGIMARGIHSASWDGTDDNGSFVSSGVYFYQVASGKSSVYGRMMLLK